MGTKLAEPTVSLDNLGFLLAKASQRFNERLVERLAEEGFGEVRGSYGSVLMPLFEQDHLRVGEIGARARLSKQAMTRLVAQCEADGLVQRSRDAADGRAFRVDLTPRGQELRSVAQRVLSQLDDEVLARVGRRDIDALRTALKGLGGLASPRRWLARQAVARHSEAHDSEARILWLGAARRDLVCRRPREVPGGGRKACCRGSARR